MLCPIAGTGPRTQAEYNTYDWLTDALPRMRPPVVREGETMTRTSTRLTAGFATTALLFGGAALFASGPADAASSDTVQLHRSGTVQLHRSGTVQLIRGDTVQLHRSGTVQLTVQL